MTIPAVAGRIDGRPAAVWLRSHRRELVDRALAGLSARGGSARTRDAQLRWIVDYNVVLFIRTLEEPDLALDEAVAADLVASAANRAGEGSPIEDLLEDYIAGTAAMWRVIAESARPEEFASVIELTDLLFGYMRSVSTLVVRGFQHEAARISMGERDARFAVYSALLSGGDPEQVAARAGVPLARRYLVLSLQLGEPPEASVAGRALQVPRLRRTNTVRRVLAEYASGDVLALMRDPLGTALVPLSAQPSAGEAADVRALLTRLADVLAAPVHAGAVFATPEHIPAAATQAEEVLELVVATGRGPGAWFLDDVVVSYQLTRPGPGRDLLADRMRPLDDHPDWEPTLRAFLTAGYDRRRTAEVLHVHPNTVDYRLSRIAAACGIDAADPAQRPAALAALCVRDLDRAADR